MSKGSEAVKRWRQNTKRRAIEAFGGKCCICEYDKCDEALEFHHLDPTNKEFTFGQMRGNIKGWGTIINELRKCVMLCSCCHKEVHSPQLETEVPNDAPRFDESFADYKILQRADLMDECPVCGIEKPKHRKTCSRSCAAKTQGKVDWDNVDVVALVKEHQNYTTIGEMFGVTGAAVSRRYKQVTR